MQVVSHTVGKFLMSYNFALDLTSIRGLYKKLWAPKPQWTQFWEFWDSQIGNPGTKWHLGASLVAMHKKYYKGEGGGFPQIQAVVSLVILCLPMAYPCTKNVPTTH